MSRRLLRTLRKRTFLRANAMHGDERACDYLEWVFNRAYGTDLKRDAANS